MEQFDINFGKLVRPMIKDDNYNFINGLKWIKHYIFEPKIGYLYFVKLRYNNILTFKIGITTKYTNMFNNNYEIVQSNFKKMNMLEASIIEYAYHKKYKQYRQFFSEKFSGYTECYRIPIKDTLTFEDAKNIINIQKTLKISEDVLDQILKNQKEIYDII